MHTFSFYNFFKLFKIRKTYCACWSICFQIFI